MRDLLLPAVQSAYITLNRPFDNFAREMDLVAGWQNPHSMQRILLKFDVESLGEGADIVSACVRMYCSRAKVGWGQLTPYLIASDWDEKLVTWDSQPDFSERAVGSTKVETASGWHYWDVTQIAQRWTLGENYGLMLMPDEGELVDWKVFDARHRFRPSLMVKYDEFSNFLQCPDGTVSAFEVAHAAGEQRYSIWRNTCNCKLYDFFVQNMGPSTVTLHVQISPDECAEYDEMAKYILEKDQTETIVPQRFAYYTRLAFSTEEPCGRAKLKIWFQAQT